MNIEVSDIQQARIRRDFLLKMNHKPLEIIAENKDNLYYIYMIESKTNPKYRYIGKAKNIYDRALNYIRTYDRLSESHHHMRPIDKALYENGLNDFIMYPIATVNGKEEAGIIEQILIKKHHTLINEEGLNVRTDIDISGGKSHAGHAHNVATKTKKSKALMAIDNKSKVILISVGGKILGDFLHTTKDMIKNVTRRPCHLRDWYIYYLNTSDREDIVKKYTSKRTSNAFGINRLRDETDEYIHGANLVDRFVDSPSPYIFADDPNYSEYTVAFIDYNPESDNNLLATTYVVRSLDDFMNLLD